MAEEEKKIEVPLVEVLPPPEEKLEERKIDEEAKKRAAKLFAGLGGVKTGLRKTKTSEELDREIKKREKEAEKAFKKEMEEIERLKRQPMLAKLEQNKRDREKLMKKARAKVSKKPPVKSIPVSKPSAPLIAVTPPPPPILSVLKSSAAAPPPKPLPADISDPKYQNILDKEKIDLDEKDFKEHVQYLDKESQKFLDEFFPSEKEKEVYGSILGYKELPKIYDNTFYSYFLNNVSYKFKKKEKYIDPHDGKEKERVVYTDPSLEILFQTPAKAGFDKTPEEERRYKRNQLAEIMQLMAGDNQQDRIATLFKFSPHTGLTSQNTQNLYNAEYINSLSPDVVALEYLQNYEIKAPEPFLEIVDQVQDAKAKLEAGHISMKQYSKFIEKMYDNLFNLSKTDKDLEKQMIQTLNQRKAYNIIEMDKFFDIYDRLKIFADNHPNNAFSLNIRQIMTNIDDNLKAGKFFDLKQLYKQLDTLGPVKEAILQEDINKIELNTKRSEEIVDVGVSKVLKDIQKVYNDKDIRKERLFGWPGINLKGAGSLSPDLPIYELSDKDILNTTQQFGYAFNGIKDLGSTKKTTPNLNDILNAIQTFEIDLGKVGMELDPNRYEVLDDIKNINPSDKDYDKIIRHGFSNLKRDMKDAFFNFDKIAQNADKALQDWQKYEYEQLKKITDEYDNKIDASSDSTEKKTLENEKDEKLQEERDNLDKMYKDLQSKRFQKGIKVFNSKMPRATAKVKTAITRARLIKPQHKPKIIIPANQVAEKSKKLRKFAEQTLFSNKTSKHEPEKGKSYYGEYATEYKINDDQDLLNMKNDISGQKGQLYIIDLRTGRLYPVSINDAFPKATYIFQKEIKGIGGGFGKFKPVHSQHAFYPTLSNILDQEGGLIPYVFLRGSYDKIPQMLHKIPKQPSYDYRDQLRELKGAGIASGLKKFLHASTIGVAKDVGNYVANKTVNAAKNLAHNSIYEGKNFVRQERQNVRNISQAGRKFGRNPNIKSLGQIVGSSTKLVSQPLITGTRELANVSDFAGQVPGLNVVKFGAEYLVPGLAVADSAAHAVKNLNIGTPEKPRYLDAAINSLDAVLGTGGLSGKIETGTKVINTGLKVADVFVDKGEH